MSAMELARYLRHRIQFLKTSNTEVASKANISRQTLHRLLNAEIESARLSTLNQLANALQTSTLGLLRIYYSEKTFHSFLSGHTPRYAVGVTGVFNVPPKSTVAPGETFDIIWDLTNIGSVLWEDFHMICLDNHLQDTVLIGNEACLRKTKVRPNTVLTDNIPVPMTLPGEHARLTTTFHAPDYPCTMISHWKIVDSNNEIVIQKPAGLFFMIQVKEAP